MDLATRLPFLQQETRDKERYTAEVERQQRRMSEPHGGAAPEMAALKRPRADVPISRDEETVGGVKCVRAGEVLFRVFPTVVNKVAL